MKLARRSLEDGHITDDGHFVTGQEQILYQIHSRRECLINGFCVIHNPSPHAMRHWKTYWSVIEHQMYRTCPHGKNVQDPDGSQALRYVRPPRYEYLGWLEHDECEICSDRIASLGSFR